MYFYLMSRPATTPHYWEWRSCHFSKKLSLHKKRTVEGFGVTSGWSTASLICYCFWRWCILKKQFLLKGLSSIHRAVKWKGWWQAGPHTPIYYAKCTIWDIARALWTAWHQKARVFFFFLLLLSVEMDLFFCLGIDSGSIHQYWTE